MCGIAGAVSTTGVASDIVRRMCDAIVHRGPDSGGLYEDEHAALGIRRLAIIDVAGSDQPVYNEDRSVVVVFNGELYNFASLRAELRSRGHRLGTAGDTECLVHLYEEFGTQLVHRLRGMFAFAIWDRRRKRLLLARDRVGKKPLYWRHTETSLSFGSELKALVQDPALRREVDPVALDHFLTYQYVPAPWSIYREVYKLPPGHLLVWQDGTVDVRRYWRLDSTPRPVADEEEAAEQLREHLLEATRIRMVSERPLGAFLSGGCRSDGTPVDKPDPDVHHRLRRPAVRRTALRPHGRRPVPDRTPRDGGQSVRPRRVAHPGVALRRALRRLLGDSQLLRRADEPTARDGRAQRRRRR
jgi:asparagine synthase (glutamine-hydrolysing)